MSDDSNVKSLYWARKKKEEREADMATVKDVPAAAALTPEQVSAIVEEAFKRKQVADAKKKAELAAANAKVTQQYNLLKPKPKGKK